MDDDKEVYCCDCAHVVGRRTYTDTADAWSCHATGNVIDTGRDFVTGKTIYNLRSSTCYDTRGDDSLCGRAGQWFQAYTPPTYHSEPLAGGRDRPRLVGGQRVTADNLLAELENFSTEKK